MTPPFWRPKQDCFHGIQPQGFLQEIGVPNSHQNSCGVCLVLGLAPTKWLSFRFSPFNSKETPMWVGVSQWTTKGNQPKAQPQKMLWFMPVLVVGATPCWWVGDLWLAGSQQGMSCSDPEINHPFFMVSFFRQSGSFTQPTPGDWSSSHLEEGDSSPRKPPASKGWFISGSLRAPPVRPAPRVRGREAVIKGYCRQGNLDKASEWLDRAKERSSFRTGKNGGLLVWGRRSRVLGPNGLGSPNKTLFGGRGEDPLEKVTGV